ncbi:MAG: hypothetical protein IJH55_10105 [Romboutsia sp.]|nr:hypothetical protein [Romboutsia sp.]
MKVAVIKLGSRISISSTGTSGGTVETLSIIKILTTAGISVDAYTKILDKDESPKDFSIYNIEDEYKNINDRKYNSLIVLNGNVNYFGGVDDPSQTLNYWVINNFKGKVFYVMCDCNLLLKQIWPSIEKKKWASNYKKEDIYITRNDIVYLSQARFIHKVKEKANKLVHIKDVIYFPFEKFPMLTMDNYPFNEDTTYDLLYGGTFRGGRREDDMIKYYFGYDDKYKVEMFGKIDINNFNLNKIAYLKPPIFGQSVTYDKFGAKMSEANATVIIGDPIYKSWGDLAQRIYESIIIGNIVLIDSAYDFQKKVFKNSELKDFCYVSYIEEVEDRLDKIRDKKFRRHLVDLQREDTKIDIQEYCNLLKKIIEEN